MKAACTGLLSGFAAAVLYVVVKFVGEAAYFSLVVVPRAQAEASGASSWDAYRPQTFDLRGPLLIGFVVGVWWTLRRARARA